jgi:hypothetical protein
MRLEISLPDNDFLFKNIDDNDYKLDFPHNLIRGRVISHSFRSFCGALREVTGLF